MHPIYYWWIGELLLVEEIWGELSRHISLITQKMNGFKLCVINNLGSPLWGWIADKNKVRNRTLNHEKQFCSYENDNCFYNGILKSY